MYYVADENSSLLATEDRRLTFFCTQTSTSWSGHYTSLGDIFPGSNKIGKYPISSGFQYAILPNICKGADEWGGGQYITIGLRLGVKVLICSICQFLWYKYYHYDPIQSTRVTHWVWHWEKRHMVSSYGLVWADSNVPLKSNEGYLRLVQKNRKHYWKRYICVFRLEGSL